MSKNFQSKTILISRGILTGALILSGCAGVRVHDESKAIVTAGIKEKYAQANVLGVIDVEKQNLDNLLAEELKVVRDNQKLQVDFALLSIADNNTPMGATYAQEAVDRLKKLGYSDNLKQVRTAVLEEADLKAAKRAMDVSSDLIRNITGRMPPPCPDKDSLPQELLLPESISDQNRVGAQFLYKRYQKDCTTHQNLLKKQPGGDTRQAYNEWKTAEAKHKEILKSIDDARKALKEKRDAYNQALERLNEAKKSGDELEQQIRDEAALLLNDLESAKEVAKLIDPGIVAEERLNAIIVLLTAAAGEEINTSEPDIKKAATIVKEIPSLAGDIQGLLEQAKAPSVNNLLIEMRHQVQQLEYAKQLQTLSQQRLDILRVKYDAFKEEARYWLAFGDAMCSYAVLSAGKAFPGQRCDDFVISSDGTCKLGDEEISNCALGEPWNTNIQAQSSKAATRELYKALAAYLRALAVQSKPPQQDFRLIDVRHRETLAAKESAIRGWDNLVAVPIDQIYAYYQAGLKPAEIGDLLVKALGFTAVAIGLAQ